MAQVARKIFFFYQYDFQAISLQAVSKQQQDFSNSLILLYSYYTVFQLCTKNNLIHWL